MAEKSVPYDPANALESPEDIALFMEDALESGDAAFVAKAIGIAARTLAVMKALGLSMSVKPGRAA